MKVFVVLAAAAVPAYGWIDVRAETAEEAMEKVRADIKNKKWDSDIWVKGKWETQWENVEKLPVVVSAEPFAEI